MNTERQDNVSKLKNRLQFILLLTLFLPTLIDALFRQYPDSAVYTHIILSWGNVIAFLIVDYIAIEIFENYITASLAKLISIVMLVPPLAFATVFTLAAEYPKTMPHNPTLIFKACMYFLDAFPFILLLLLLWSFGSFLAQKKRKI
jgi:hypothetical protein